MTALGTSRRGLDAAEVRRRRAAVGPNVLREVEPVSMLTLVANQFKSLVVALLLAAAGVSLFFGDTIEAIAIGVVLLLNAGIGFFTEWRAVRSMEALREIGHVPAVVRRNGTERQVRAESLVPGDIVVLEEGDIITADVRLLDTSKLQVDESALTGESVPVDKDESVVEAETPLAERSCMVYKGTSVTRGAGLGVVVATGMETEIGEISSLVETAEQESTPLEVRLDQLARSLVAAVLVLTAAVSATGLLGGRELHLMIETGIALAVAAIPEGLPVVATIALARGMRRMARRNALVRRLSSVETLGATSVICTDKTGTLTENAMTVTRLVLATDDDAPVEVSLGDDGPVSGDAPSLSRPQTRLAAQVASLCNAAQLQEEQPALGDPMEIALLRFAQQVGLDLADQKAQFPEVQRVAFDRTTKMMASVRRGPDGFWVAVKGAPEAVLDACTTEAPSTNSATQPLLNGGIPLTEERRQYWQARNEALAAEGLRVLALAAKSSPSATPEPYEGLQFIGLLGLVDPPRSDVRAAIDECQRAGIRVVMVTGDQPSTAQYVARAVGLVDTPDAPAIHGQSFDALLRSAGGGRQLHDIPIFARVTPKQKLDLIDLHQEAGRIVAMTGDGVNDAPALRSADIGVAMGQRGTQVAQEAADMVLQDDAFSTIVAAVEEGRAIFTNIRAFVRYLLSCNVGEVMVVGLAALLGLPLPLLPLQILFLNLVTDVFPALALGMGEAETDVMKAPPRPADEPVLMQEHWWGIAGYGALFTVSALGAMLGGRAWYGFSLEEAVTVSFLTLAFGQLWHVFNMRSPASSWHDNVIVSNPFVWGAIGLCTALLLVAVYVPVVANVLSLVPPDRLGWLLIAGASLLPLLVGQIGLGVRPRA
jgi:Ca2+-transporting ATPase